MSDVKRWNCPKCKTWNSLERKKCAFCSFEIETSDEPNKKLDRLTQSLHNTIEKMNPGQKTKMWRWLEDNVL